MNIPASNPLIQEHVAVLHIRKEITKAFPGSVIEVSQPTIRSDYTYVEAQVKLKDDRATSVCRGMVISIGTSLQRALNAELVALVMCANELGLDVVFEGEAKKLTTPAVDQINTLEVFDAETVMQCETVKDVFITMKRLGIDTTGLETLQNQLHREGKRINKKIIIEKLFGGKKKKIVASVVKEEPEPTELPVKQEAERLKISSLATTKSVRTTDEATHVLNTLLLADIGTTQVKKHTSYTDIYSFSRGASDQEIENLIEICKQ